MDCHEPCISGLLAIAAFALAVTLGSAQTLAQNAYIPNYQFGNVSVINTPTNTVIATIPVGNSPLGVAVSPNGSRVYITNEGSGTVSVIDAATNTVIATIPIGAGPFGVAVSRDGSRVYVAAAEAVQVIDAATNTVTATINNVIFCVDAGFAPNSNDPSVLAVSPDGSKVYAVAPAGPALLVIDTATNTKIGCLPAPGGSSAVAVTPDGAKAYETSYDAGLWVVNTVTGASFNIPLPQPHDQIAAGVAVAPDGGRIYGFLLRGRFRGARTCMRSTQRPIQ